MKRWMTPLTVLLALMAPSAALAQSFTYQGRLTDASGPVDGTVNLTVKLYDAAAAGIQHGNTLNFNALNVSDGLFTVGLNFGFNNTLAFSNGTARWLEISVNGTTLAPRQELTPTPYALRSMKPWESSSINTNDIFFTGNGIFGTGKVGIGDTTPTALLTIGDGDKVQVTDAGHVRFADPAGGIVFPDTNLNSGPMIQMFELGNTLPTSRMIIQHSVNFPMEGLQYANHAYSFRSASNIGLFIDPVDEFVGVNRTARVTTAEFFGIQAPVSGTSYGGMYIRTNGGTAKPFYGYSSGTTHDAWTYLDGTTGDWRVNVDGDRMTVTETGNVGIGTTAPAVRLHVEGGTDSEPGGGGFLVLGATNGANISFDNNEIMARNNGQPATLFLNNDGGAVRVPVLEITGADVAEKFPASGPREAIKPGMVMEIDPENAGKLRISHAAYNRRVAGVVSGAGDIPVGAILGNLPGHEDAPPIALSGRVWVQCDASELAISAGDLLTTAENAGYAMKVTDYPRAQGAIIGKAMSNLAQGEKGLVLVLVNLQ